MKKIGKHFVFAFIFTSATLLTFHSSAQFNTYIFSAEREFKDTLTLSGAQTHVFLESKDYKEIRTLVGQRMELDSIYYVKIYAEYALGKHQKPEIYAFKTNVILSWVEQEKLKRYFEQMLERSNLRPLKDSPDSLFSVTMSFHHN
ncbi:MAG: hypothetical protein ACK49D_09810 [Flavobacteriia bacterium]|jgi:hypothetical protein|nr:hypothetical protein [Cryomorphaceae bacterium]